jgi:hypothetical protein
MTPAPLLDSPHTIPPLTKRFRRWGSWLFFLLLTGNVIVCHGCHRDEDNELCAPPPARREIRNEDISVGVGSVSDGVTAFDHAAGSNGF